MARIMVVEDERALADQMVWALEHAGYDVWPSYNGVQALERLGLEPKAPGAPVPDLIVLDVMMPSLNGVEVCERLAASPRLSVTPVIVVSGKGETRGAFRKFPNVAAYLDKPFETKKLLDAIAAALLGPR